MPLWGKTDALESAPKYLKDPADYPEADLSRDYNGVNNSENLENAYLVDTTEASVVSNKEKGLGTPGWVLYNSYTDANGNVRHKSEVLVAMKVSAINAGDEGISGNTNIEDTIVADS